MKSKTSAEMGDAPLLSSRTSPARGRRDASSLFGLGRRQEMQQSGVCSDVQRVGCHNLLMACWQQAGVQAAETTQKQQCEDLIHGLALTSHPRLDLGEDESVPEGAQPPAAHVSPRKRRLPGWEVEGAALQW